MHWIGLICALLVSEDSTGDFLSAAGTGLGLGEEADGAQSQVHFFFPIKKKFTFFPEKKKFTFFPF